MISTRQIRAARGMLGMSQIELAESTGLAIMTISKIEKDDRTFYAASFDTLKKIEKALAAKGIEFIDPEDDENLNGIGIIYYPSKKKD